jgi:hypothetical protein
MKAQLKKELALTGLRDVRAALLEQATNIPVNARDTIFLGVWSVKDLLAHLTGWDFTNIAAIKAVQAGELPAFYAHSDRDWKSYNAMLVASYKRDRFTELLALVKDSHVQLVEMAQTIPPENFVRDFGVRFRGYKVTIQRLLEAEQKDEKIHLEQLLTFRQTLEK